MRRARSLRSTTRSARLTEDADTVWSVVASGRSGPQWYVDAAPFRLRGGIDRLVGGAGARWSPPGRPLLRTGDRVGFWRVVEADHAARRLTLEAQVRAPGTVRLATVVAPEDAGSTITQTVSLAPRGALGAAYLVADLPARAVVAELTMLHLLTVLRRPSRDAESPTPRDAT